MATVKPTGKKEVSTSDAPRVDEQIMAPGKYEVTPESVFNVDVHLKKKGERWIVVREEGKGVESHKIVFRMWGYDEMVDLKKRCTAYDPNKRIHSIDQDALNHLKIQKLMVSWTFGAENPRLKIHRVQGVLMDESWTNFKRLQSNIIDYIMVRMNEVLDYNG